MSKGSKKWADTAAQHPLAGKAPARQAGFRLLRRLLLYHVTLTTPVDLKSVGEAPISGRA